MQDSENLIIFFSTCMISLKVEKGGKRHRSVSCIHFHYLLLMIKLFEKHKLYIHSSYSKGVSVYKPRVVFFLWFMTFEITVTVGFSNFSTETHI